MTVTIVPGPEGVTVCGNLCTYNRYPLRSSGALAPASRPPPPRFPALPFGVGLSCATAVLKIRFADVSLRLSTGVGTKLQIGCVVEFWMEYRQGG